jgi:hypothetical protein
MMYERLFYHNSQGKPRPYPTYSLIKAGIITSMEFGTTQKVQKTLG